MADNKVRFGASNVRYALENEDGTFGDWKRLAGTVQIAFEPQGNQNTFYADNVGYFISNGASSDSITVELADLTDEAKQDLLGYVMDDESGLLYEPVVSVRRPFAMGYQVEGDLDKLRGVRYGGTLNRPSESHNTTTDSTDPDTISIEGTFVGKTFTINGEDVPILGAACKSSAENHDAYDSFWNAVPQPGVAPGTVAPATTTLSALEIGDLELTPEFAAGTTTYTATATEDTDTVTATATDDAATVSITVNGTAVTSGGYATWQEGQNVVSVIVTNEGETNAYTVIVTK